MLGSDPLGAGGGKAFYCRIVKHFCLLYVLPFSIRG